MPLYRVHFVDHGGNVYMTDHVEHDDDEKAIEDVRRRSSRVIGAGYEIWEGDRLVHQRRY